MQIVCPTCTTSYDLEPAALGAGGRSVRCVRCRTVWFATPSAEPVLAALPAPVPQAAVADDPAPPDQTWGDDIAQPGEFEWSLSPDNIAVESETATAASAKAAEAAADDSAQGAVDALWAAAESEPLVQKEAPPLVPVIEPDAKPVAEPHVTAKPDNIETVAARRAPQRKAGKRKLQWPNLQWPNLKWPRPGMAAAIVALAAILAGLVVWRSPIVRLAPQTASLFGAIGLPVNLRGLVFENVRTIGEVNEGVPVLIVEGTIANVTSKTVEVPRLRFAMRNRAEHEIYAWTSVTGRSILAPGETASFRTRLASPPPDGRDVIVRFFNRRDFLAGMR